MDSDPQRKARRHSRTSSIASWTSEHLADWRSPASRDHFLCTRRLFLVLIPVVVVATVALIVTLSPSSLDLRPIHTPVPVNNGTAETVAVNEPVWKKVLNGPPTEHFRDNLRNDTKYITGFLGGGWTNDFMTFVNMIYLGILTERVPIIGPFLPTHIGWNESLLPFSEIFDTERLSELLDLPIIEWWQVKDQSSSQIDALGCWSPWAVSGPDNMFRGNGRWLDFGLDPSFTPTPRDVNYYDGPGDWHIRFWPLAELGFPSGRAREHGETWPSTYLGVTLEPDEQVLCYDFLYYAVADRPSEWNEDYSPAWRFVGTHVHWSAWVEGLAKEYLRRIFGVKQDADVPPFISVHVRRNDFTGWCPPGAPQEECFAPLSAYARRVEEVREELLITRGITADHVIMTSDERDPAWWDEVRALGWKFADHAAEQTSGKYGKWYPPVLDACFQSMGAGFVGTAESTMSNVAKRRVQDWNNGVARTVMWGSKDADDH